MSLKTRKLGGAALGAAVATLLALSYAGARDLGAGNWHLAVGNAPACTVTLAADGTLTAEATCLHTAGFARWRKTDAGVEFTDGAGQAVAVLKAQGDVYAGKTLGEYHQLVLTP